ncbi:MAG: hypothetical protein VYC39_06105 [Myxococcota bacterium]|nr:hypothetical protein [Myxococcota bacterium]
MIETELPELSWRTSVEHEFAAPEHYDLVGTLKFHRFGLSDPSVILTPTHMRKLQWWKGQPLYLEIEHHKESLNVRCTGPGHKIPRQVIEKFLGIHASAFQVEGHAFMARLSRQYRGIFPTRTLHLGYDLVRTVMQQLIEWKDAARAWRHFLRQTGSSTPVDSELLLPPSYEQIHRAPIDLLHSSGISQRRCLTIREVARIGHRIDSWACLEADEIRNKLSHIPNIGPWTIEHCLGFSLNQPDAIPLGDYQLPHTVSWALEGQDRGDDEKMLKLLAPWEGRQWTVLRLLFAANVRAPRKGPRLNLGKPNRPRFGRRKS